MCRKLIYLFSVVLLLGLVGNVRADPNLVAHWTFYDGSTDDISGYGTPANGTLMRDAKVVKDPNRGLVLQVYNNLNRMLGGPPDDPNYMYVGNPAKFGITGQITVAAWIKPDSWPFLNFDVPEWCIVSKGFDGWYLVGVLDLGFIFNIEHLSGDDDVYNWEDPPGAVFDGQWHHFAGVYDGENLYLYVDGSGDVGIEAHTGSITQTPFPIYIGAADMHGEALAAMDGLIDDVRIYNRALSAQEIDDIIAEPIMVAYNAWNPNPADGKESVGPISTTTLSWTRPEPRQGGDILCDVLFGTDPCMVIGPNTTQIETYADVNSTTNFDPLDPETIYYWRVDCYDPNGGGEVKTTGRVWSFDTINRAPTVSVGNRAVVMAAGSATVQLDATVTDDGLPEGTGLSLEWTVVSGPNIPGTVTFDPSATVEDPNATFTEAGEYVLLLTADDGLLDANDTATIKVYPEGWDPCGLIALYEFEDDVGSHTCADTSGYPGVPKDGTLFGDPTFVAGRVGSGALDLDGDDYVTIDAVSDDITSNNITLSAWVRTTDYYADWFSCNSFSGGNNFRFCISNGKVGFDTDEPRALSTTTVSDGEWYMLTFVRSGATGYIYVDGVLENSHPISGESDFSLSSDDRWSIGQEWDGAEPSNFLIGTVDDARVYNHALELSEIEQLYLDAGSESTAYHPSPKNGATGVATTVTLSWLPTDDAVSRDVYLGTDFDDVNDANTTVPLGVYKGNVSDPCYPVSPALDLETTYYWRIDEVNAGGNRARGRVWRFTTVDYFIVDDFESYNPNLLDTWTEAGWAYAYLSVSPDPVHGGTKAMRVEYQNQFDPFISEVFRTPADPNWTRAGVKALDLWYRGDATNVAGQPIYVRLHDSDSDATVTYAAPDLQNESWQVWRIALKDFTGVDMNNVTKLVIGIGDGADSGQPGGDTDIAYFDDIRLYKARCFTSLVPTDFTGDCITNNRDLDIMVGDWLDGDYTVSAAEPDPNRMVVQYKFEEGSGTTAVDSSGNSNDGTISGNPVWDAAGYDGNCLTFDGLNDYVVKTGANNLPTGADDDWSINMYLYMDVNQEPNSLIGGFGAATGILGEERYLVSPSDIVDGISLWLGDVMGEPWGFSTGEPFDVNTGTWQTITITREGTTTRIFKNGTEIESDSAVLPAASATVKLATADLSGRFKGKIDEFTIWQGTMTEAEILYLANVSERYYPLTSVANPYNAEPTNFKKINFRDYAILGNEWLKEELFGN